MASIVIKVKYEETLRRFNVAINGDRRLDLNIEGLRLKICSLFNLPSDSQFRLTYKDEDDDVVTLVDDDDLHDVVRQGLDPVRITVHLISDQRPQSSSAHPSGSSKNLDGVKTVNSDEGWPVKTVFIAKEPQSEAMASYGSSKVGVSHENATLSNSSVISVSHHDKVGNDTKRSSVGWKHKAVKSDLIEKRSEATGVRVSGRPPLCPSVSLDKGKHPSYLSSSSKVPKSGDRKKSKDDLARERDAQIELWRSLASKRESIWDAALNTLPQFSMTSVVHTGITCDGCGIHPIRGPRFKSKVMYDYDLCHSCFLLRGNEMDYNRIDFPLGYKPPQSVQAFNADSMGSIFHEGIACDRCGTAPISGARFKSKAKYNYDLCSICFSQTGNNRDYARIDFPLTYTHLDRAPYVDGMGVIFHTGVTCDGCRAFPIRGPRFKSKVRIDYDLCSTCFSWMGNDKDYIRITTIDSPWVYKHPPSAAVPDVKSPCPYMTGPRVLKDPELRLDSWFIKDVSISYGTTMAPSTPFTKIWRMRNNGTLPWFHGVQLIWIGGSRFSPSDSIEIQVPVSGLDVGHELNIAVDFIAPELPGRYNSMWRMADPSGQMFGPRLLVQIKVDPSVDLTREILPTLDLNVSPVSNKNVFPEVANVKAEPGLDIEVSKSSAPSIVDQNHKIQMADLNLSINDDLLVAGNAVYPNSTSASSLVSPPAANADGPRSRTGPSSVSYPEVDTSSYSTPEASTPIQSDPTNDSYGELVPSSVSYPEADAVSYSIPEASIPIQADYSNEKYREFWGASLDAENLDNNDSLGENNLEQVNEKTETEEEKLLKELEQIGFKQIDLDKEVESGLSVDDLSDDSDWDPILEELKEMCKFSKRYYGMLLFSGER
ncbi:hypothetical protein KSS87_005237 [Heliosperma pusillum]|nr:hypothetical protein KSS87_005237 [Heliosperma pusillum]